MPTWIMAGSIALCGGVAMWGFARWFGELLGRIGAGHPDPSSYRLAWRQWQAHGGAIVSPTFEDPEAAGIWRRRHDDREQAEMLTLVRVYDTDIGLVLGQVDADEIAAALAASGSSVRG